MSRIPLASAEVKFRRIGHGSQAMPNNSKWYSINDTLMCSPRPVTGPCMRTLDTRVFIHSRAGHQSSVLPLPRKVHRPIGWDVTCQLPARHMPVSNFFASPTLNTLPIALIKNNFCSQYTVQKVSLFNICVGAVVTVEKIIKKWLPATAKCYLPLWLCLSTTTKSSTCLVTCHTLVVL
jgi:hypothetical protein